MLMRAIAHGCCADTVRQSALEADCGKRSLAAPGTRTASLLRLDFQSDALADELSLPPVDLALTSKN